MKVPVFEWSCCLLLGVLGQEVSWTATPVSHLAEQADLVVLGEAVSMQLSKGGGVEFGLQSSFTLKGEAPGAVFMATLPPSDLMAQHQERTVTRVNGWYGLWFLKQTDGSGYVVLPPHASDYIEREAFVAVPNSWVPPTRVDLERQLLRALQESYVAQARPKSAMAEALLIVSLEAADDRDAALDVVEKLMESSWTEDRVIGIALGIRLGSNAALNRLASELDSLQLEQRFNRITFALHAVYTPNGPDSIAVLQRLIERRSSAPGLDVAIGHSLQRVLDREILPTVALLLESPDPEAKRTAGWLFHSFTALAGADGRVNRSGSSDGRHPFWNEATRWFSGKRKEISSDEQAAFWIQWWSENRAKLGFSQ